MIPWRDTGCPHRRAHLWHLRWLYGQAGHHIVIGDPPGEFNRAAARNAGVRASTSTVVAVVDADNLIAPDMLHAAGLRAQSTGRLVKPFTTFGYLDQRSTDAYYEHGGLSGATWEGDGPQVGFAGGAYVLRRDVWDTLGGFDEQFTGWGAEDDAFTIHAERVLGPAVPTPGPCYHLWHPSPGRVTSPENYSRLMEVYVHGEPTR